MATHANESAVLQDLQQLRLNSQIEAANLIQKQRAVVRLLHAAEFCGHSPSKSALFVAEQLGFNQRVKGIAGQLTLTSDPRARIEKACSRRTQISLPVPLSPCIRTGTSVSATRSSLLRTACIAAVLPKKISRGRQIKRDGGFGVMNQSHFFLSSLGEPASMQYGSYLHVKHQFFDEEGEKGGESQRPIRDRIYDPTGILD